MSEDHSKPRRAVAARRSLTLGTLAAALAGSAAPAAVTLPADLALRDVAGLASAVPGDGGARVLMAASEGGEGGEGGEGEGRAVDPGTALMRDLGFIEGHLRAGMALYEAGDLEAARTHMGHPIKEKYGAVAEAAEASGHGRLRAEIVALADAADAGAEMAALTPLFETVRATIEEMRAAQPVRTQVAGLIALMRIAGDEYGAALTDGRIEDLHEYQDSWGFLRVVAVELDEMAAGADADAAAVAARMRENLAATDAIYGDLQGQGDFEPAPSVIFGAAARMELAAARLK